MKTLKYLISPISIMLFFSCNYAQIRDLKTDDTMINTKDDSSILLFNFNVEKPVNSYNYIFISFYNSHRHKNFNPYGLVYSKNKSEILLNKESYNECHVLKIKPGDWTLKEIGYHQRKTTYSPFYYNKNPKIFKIENNKVYWMGSISHNNKLQTIITNQYYDECMNYLNTNFPNIKYDNIVDLEVKDDTGHKKNIPPIKLRPLSFFL